MSIGSEDLEVSGEIKKSSMCLHWSFRKGYEKSNPPHWRLQPCMNHVAAPYQ
jgi:hypothetical protein